MFSLGGVRFDNNAALDISSFAASGRLWRDHPRIVAEPRRLPAARGARFLLSQWTGYNRMVADDLSIAPAYAHNRHLNGSRDEASLHFRAGCARFRARQAHSDRNPTGLQGRAKWNQTTSDDALTATQARASKDGRRTFHACAEGPATTIEGSGHRQVRLTAGWASSVLELDLCIGTAPDFAVTCISALGSALDTGRGLGHSARMLTRQKFVAKHHTRQRWKKSAAGGDPLGDLGNTRAYIPSLPGPGHARRPRLGRLRRRAHRRSLNSATPSAWCTW